MHWLLFVSVVAVVWPYFGYPGWLWVLTRLKSSREIPSTVEPLQAVTLIISAYNEGQVIRQKLENLRGLAYPSELLDVMVISDASDDDTDDIVREFRDERVTLCRQEQRKGKTAGLSRFAPQASGELILFSDANTIFDANAVRRLVSHFSDPSVGYVVGQQKYLEDQDSDVSNSEGLYWRYETWIKKHESIVDSVVGGDGAIYAIRKELFTPLRDDDINDFVNPLQIIARGYRGRYEPDAICYERAAGTYEGEFRRKVRIVNRSIRALWRVPSVMNPLRHGLFSLHVISHKLLRWFAAFFMFAALVANVVLVIQDPSVVAKILLVLQGLFYSLAIAGLIPTLRKGKFVSLPFYFCLANLAAGCGVIQYAVGTRHVIWTPERGDDQRQASTANGWLLWISGVVIVMAFVGSIIAPISCCIILAILVVYAYLFYPLLMWIWPKRVRNQLKFDWPSLAILIPAHNEIESIDAKIRNTMALDYPTELVSIYVVDDASEDGTTEALGKWQPSIECVNLAERSGKSAAIGKAMEKITADVILLTDANVIIEPNAPRRLVQALAMDGVVCATANVILESEHDAMKAEGHYQSFELWLQAMEAASGSAVSVDGGLYVVNREYFVCPSPNTILDDFAVSANVINQGGEIAVVRDAIATESSCPKLRQDFRRRVRIGQGISQALRHGMFPSPISPFTFIKFVSHKLMRWLSPFFVAAIVICMLQIAFQMQMLVHFGIGLTGIILVAFAGLMLPGARKLAWCNTFGFMLVAMSGLVIGMVMGLFRSPSATWEHGQRALVASPSVAIKASN